MRGLPERPVLALVAVGLAFALASAAGCGKKGAPSPPENPLFPSALKAAPPSETEPPVVRERQRMKSIPPP